MLYPQPEFEFLIYLCIASDLVPAKPLINLRRRVAKICGYLVLKVVRRATTSSFQSIKQNADVSCIDRPFGLLLLTGLCHSSYLQACSQ